MIKYKSMTEEIGDNLIGEAIFFYVVTREPKVIICINCGSTLTAKDGNIVIGLNGNCTCGDVLEVLKWRRGVYEG